MSCEDILVAGATLLCVGVVFWIMGDNRAAAWVACVGGLVTMAAVWRECR